MPGDLADLLELLLPPFLVVGTMLSVRESRVKQSEAECVKEQAGVKL